MGAVSYGGLLLQGEVSSFRECYDYLSEVLHNKGCSRFLHKFLLRRSAPAAGRKVILVQDDSPEKQASRGYRHGGCPKSNRTTGRRRTAMQPQNPTLKMLIREVEEARDEYCRLLIVGDKLLKRARAVSQTIEERVCRATGRNSFPSTPPLQDSGRTE
jgi:hypothetical protein